MGTNAKVSWSGVNPFLLAYGGVGGEDGNVAFPNIRSFASKPRQKETGVAYPNEPTPIETYNICEF